MCLTKVISGPAKVSDLIVDGWKEFDGKPPTMAHQSFGGTVVMDTWLKASEVRAPTGIRASDGKKYQAGFHIYAEESELKNRYRLRRVYYRRVTCVGEQDGSKCVIAQEMYVPSNQDSWPPLPPPQAKKNLMKRIKGAS
jgi:hypothetical protein